VEQKTDDDDRQARFNKFRDAHGFAVNENEHLIYVLEFKRVSDIGETYVAETQRMTELQHLAVTQAPEPLECGLRAHREIGWASRMVYTNYWGMVS
jgi:hypothetical protein